MHATTNAMHATTTNAMYATTNAIYATTNAMYATTNAMYATTNAYASTMFKPMWFVRRRVSRFLIFFVGISHFNIIFFCNL
jgi:hypothetical protein